jgi:ATP-dependent exoDNAse (exonuclease V) alpha subunit
MALFHFTADQIKRSEGQSVVASAAYRSGEKLHSAYYGEDSDYTRKKGVICSEILLPSHVPRGFADRETLWNAVEHAEHGKKAQLAYSFEISLQNEFSLEENIALARQFLLDNFVSRGMTVDVAFHEKETEEGGTPNPHFHFLCPIRPMNPDGTWGFKQHRVYRLDEDGNRIRDRNGKFLFDAVPTTDWGAPETLEQWRKAWADVCNAKFAEKGLDVRIDHRSYERQGLDLLPTVHEGAAVRAMEKKGICTEKGEFNRWIKTTNAVIRDIRGKIAVLLDWIKEAKAELDKPKSPDLASLLGSYYAYRKSKAYSQKGKLNNLKEMNETFNYLRENGIATLADLESRVQSHQTTVDSLKATLDSQNARMKTIRSLSDDSETFQRLKPVFAGLQKIKFDKPRAAYKAAHEAELKQFYAARRRLNAEFPDGKVDMKKLSEEYSTLEQTHAETYAQFKTIREDLQKLWSVKSKIDTARSFHERTEEQTLQNRPQTRHKKEDIDR